MDIIPTSNIHILVYFYSNMAMVIESCMVNLHLGREQPLHARVKKHVCFSCLDGGKSFNLHTS
jgi:hypothetical protein